MNVLDDLTEGKYMRTMVASSFESSDSECQSILAISKDKGCATIKIFNRN